ncbi:hypothetical protein LINPERPRIM_LOCUS23588 [Linum perenne]
MKQVEGQGRRLPCFENEDCGRPNLCRCVSGFCFCVGKPVLLEDAHLLSKDKEDHDQGHN